MATTPHLKQAAHHLAHAHHTLQHLATTPPRQRTARKMRPTFGPQSPSPDGDWALNLTWQLMRETRDDLPSGFRTIAIDALSHTPARGYTTELNPAMLCAHINRWASDITQHFPAADELIELMEGQAHYIHQQLDKRYGKPTNHGEPPKPRTSDIVCALAGQQGLTITPKQLRQWARHGHIHTWKRKDGRNLYNINEAIGHARDQHKPKPAA